MIPPEETHTEFVMDTKYGTFALNRKKKRNRLPVYKKRANVVDIKHGIKLFHLEILDF